MDSLQGHFLVASSHLGDPNFTRTVVLMIQHNADGAFGVVVNRPSDDDLRDLWEKVSSVNCTTDDKVYIGGPVPGPLLAIHGDEQLGELEVVAGVYFSAQRENLEKIIRQSEHPFRFLIGHSGWGPGQLESELKQGAWLTTAATREIVFAPPADVWKHVTNKIGAHLFTEALGIRDVPDEPGLN